MRKLLIMSAALAAGALSLSATAAQQGQQTSTSQQTAAEGTKVTGTVTEASKDKQQITVDGQQFRMEMGGGAAMWPNVGDKVTLYYEERNGQKTVTRIGQAQQ